MTLSISADKWHFDEKGRKKELSISEIIDVGLFDKYPDSSINMSNYEVKKFHVESNELEIRLLTDTAPTYLMIDPNYYFLDKDMRNNIFKIGDD